MTPGIKMLVMARDRDTGKGYGYETRRDKANYPSYDHRGPGTDYPDVEGRFRDRRGREHYDNGRFAPMGIMDEPEENYGPESRRYRRHDDGRSAYRNDVWETYPYPPLVPPIYRGEEAGTVNRIGFSLANSNIGREMGHDYRSDAGYRRTNEMEHRTNHAMMGRASGRGEMKLTEEMAEEWMDGIQNEDGTKGPHWTLDQVKQIINQRGIQCDPIKLWVAMNAEYSDRSEVNKKHNVNTIDFYVDSAVAFWLKDKDAVDDKEAIYFLDIVKK